MWNYECWTSELDIVTVLDCFSDGPSFFIPSWEVLPFLTLCSTMWLSLVNGTVENMTQADTWKNFYTLNNSLSYCWETFNQHECSYMLDSWGMRDHVDRFSCTSHLRYPRWNLRYVSETTVNNLTPTEPT